jgi:hypothetical protein
MSRERNATTDKENSPVTGVIKFSRALAGLYPYPVDDEKATLGDKTIETVRAWSKGQDGQCRFSLPSAATAGLERPTNSPKICRRRSEAKQRTMGFDE